MRRRATWRESVSASAPDCNGEPGRLCDWLTWANRTPTAPHLAVTGPSRSGKTTLVLAVLSDREGELVIGTPKATSTDPWGGFGAVRLSVTMEAISYAPIVDAIHQVYRELLRRNAEDTILQDVWLTLIIDDYSTVVAEAPEVRPLVLRLWTLGASARIRVVVIDCEENVKAWGIESRGEARSNLVFIRLTDDHRATMYRWGQVPTPIDTREIQRLAGAARLAGRAWRGLSVCLPSPTPDSGVQMAPTDRRRTTRPRLPCWRNSVPGWAVKRRGPTWPLVGSSSTIVTGPRRACCWRQQAHPRPERR